MLKVIKGRIKFEAFIEIVVPFLSIDCIACLINLITHYFL